MQFISYNYNSFKCSVLVLESEVSAVALIVSNQVYMI